MNSFNDMSILNEIKLALEDMGFSLPTPIQQEVIPLILDNNDVCAQAPTGTGKTCAFGIPAINNLDLEVQEVQILILCPTRELVIQTQNELNEVCKYLQEVKITSIYGGQNIDRQLAALRKKPQIVIGTTGRVMDHLRRKTLKLGSLKTLVLDEMDEMLNMGFREDIDVILKSAPDKRQTVLFSATMPKEIVQISKLYQTDPISIKTLHQESDIPVINQYYLTVEENDKITALISLIKEKNYSLVLVFCNTKRRVDELSAHLGSKGLSVDALHGDLRQHNRDRTMKKFRSGETQILIATDVAARGIDVDNIEAVFNFDAPHDEEYYVHRIGRTSRANKIGDAYTFISDKQIYVIRNCERYTKSVIIKTEFSKEVMEHNIDTGLFGKTLKLAKKADLEEFRSFLETQLDELSGTQIGLKDIAAALLMQVNQMTSSKPAQLSQPPRLAMKEKGYTKSGVRFFMNIGSRDDADSNKIARFIASNSDIASNDILDVYCLENYSFATVKEGNNDSMESLNGIKFNKRIVAVEVASGAKVQGAKAPRPERAFKDKPAYNDKPFKDKPFSDDRVRSARAARPERAFKDKPFSGNDYNDKSFNKPARRKAFSRFSAQSQSPQYGASQDARTRVRAYHESQQGDNSQSRPSKAHSSKPFSSKSSKPHSKPQSEKSFGKRSAPKKPRFK